ncbi:MAG: TlpA disulfide reductase family protein [Polyangiaceae bacterium]|nr:TlpA disulfide reductase family protein [Polyangiaceae bacterium]
MKLATLVQVGFLGLAVVAVYSFGAAAQDGEQRRVCTPLCAMKPSYAGLNRTAPDFELPALGGKRVKLSSYRGRVVILNFWTKNCKPCMEEMPALARLAKSVSGRKDLALVTVSTDESLADAEATLKSVLGEKPGFEVLIDPESAVVREKYGTKLYPETWFIDTNGVIRARFDGPREWDSPLVVNFAESLTLPGVCGIEYVSGKPVGPSWLCEQ